MLYLSFPVAMFWVSNQAEYFEEYIVKRKREIFPPDEEVQRKELENFKERMRVRKEQRILKNISGEPENWTSCAEEMQYFLLSPMQDYLKVIFGQKTTGWTGMRLSLWKSLQSSHIPMVCWTFSKNELYLIRLLLFHFDASFSHMNDQILEWFYLSCCDYTVIKWLLELHLVLDLMCLFILYGAYKSVHLVRFFFMLSVLQHWITDDIINFETNQHKDI